MTKLTVGQEVKLHVPNAEEAAKFGVHILDEGQSPYAKVVYVNEDGKTVNLSVTDHVGSTSALLNISTVKPKGENEFYVTAK